MNISPFIYGPSEKDDTITTSAVNVVETNASLTTPTTTSASESDSKKLHMRTNGSIINSRETEMLVISSN